MLIRLTLNAAVHAAAGLAVGGLAIAAAEGWRRARQTREPASDMPPEPTPPPGAAGTAGDSAGPPDA
jgi:hypothetical protein